MNTYADKTQDNKNQSVTSAVTQNQNSSESSSQFVDKRPEAVTQRKLHELANNSPQQKHVFQLQELANKNYAQRNNPIQNKNNNTGLPDGLKTRMENLSGISLDDVKVHRNSDKPAQLHAHAYAQGTDIHLASGQEKHLPHEAWHVVQQKQGRVKPTMQLKGKINVNDNAGLEKEADVMGVKSLQGNTTPSLKPNVVSKSSNVFQRMVINLDPTNDDINDSVPDVAKRKFSDDSFPQEEEIAAFENEMREQADNHEAVHEIIMNKASADFSGLDNSSEPIIFVGHGIYTGEFDKALGGFGRIMRLIKPQLGFQNKFWKSFDGKSLGKYLIKKGLPKTYRGQIYADGCNTATGLELGAPKSFIDDLADFLQSKGYDFLSVKGNLGWASTQDNGQESNESPMVQKAITKAVEDLQKLEPGVTIEKRNDKYDGFQWMEAHKLHKLELELEELNAEGGNKDKIEKVKLAINGYKIAVKQHGFKNSGWTPNHTKLYKNFAELNKNKEIIEFVRVRAPKKLPNKS